MNSEGSETFQLGDRVQLTGPRGRQHTFTLVEGGVFHSHKGVLAHADIIGKLNGSVIQDAVGTEYLALRPLLRDFVVSMPRGAAIIYPKDAAQILSLADIFPGARVVEAGAGSGALTLSLLRAVGESGEVVSFERREEFARVAKGNVSGYFGEHPSNWKLIESDISELAVELEPSSVDRIVLDLLTPWEYLDSAARVLKPGGVLLCYVATVTQLSRVVESIRDSGGFTEPESSESLVRGWHVEGLAVRPDHRMIAHTAFLVHARRLAPGTVLPTQKKRNKPEYSEEDVEAWTPGTLGQSESTPRRARKAARKAETLAQSSSSRREPPSASA